MRCSGNTLLAATATLASLFMAARHVCGEEQADRKPPAAKSLFIAAELGDLDRVRQIVTADKDAVKAVNRIERTALHCATEGDQREIVEFLLKAGAEVDATDAFGYTPLHVAAMSGSGSLNAARVLIAHGADVNARNGLKALQPPRKGFSVIGIAAMRGHAELIELLLKHKARVLDEADAGTLSPLHLAAMRSTAPRYLKDPQCRGNAVVIRLLVEQGIDVNIRNYSKRTPLLIAAEHGAVDTVRFLVDTYEDVEIDAEDGDGNTPLHLAVYSLGFVFRPKNARRSFEFC